MKVGQTARNQPSVLYTHTHINNYLLTLRRMRGIEVSCYTPTVRQRQKESADHESDNVAANPNCITVLGTTGRHLAGGPKLLCCRHYSCRWSYMHWSPHFNNSDCYRNHDSRYFIAFLRSDPVTTTTPKYYRQPYLSPAAISRVEKSCRAAEENEVKEPQFYRVSVAVPKPSRITFMADNWGYLRDQKANFPWWHSCAVAGYCG